MDSVDEGVRLGIGAKADGADRAGPTPLSWTVTRGDFEETAEALMSAGANVNLLDKNEFTPWMRAARMNSVRCFDLLLRRGADPTPVNDHWRKTAREMAIERGPDELRKLAESYRVGQNRR
jgi:ankyrin repeat protein